MKNLLIYTNPEGFSDEVKVLVKIHIDNSLKLGWKRDDILLYTNFAYEYNGVPTHIVPSDLDLSWDRTSNKIFVIRYLLNNDLLEDDLYWYHDFDAFQNEYIHKDKLGIADASLGVTGYGYKDQLNGGSFFFTLKAKYTFNTWCDRTVQRRRTRADEKTLTDMMRDETLQDYKLLNITYNFGMRHTEMNYAKAMLPLRVLHFHPDYNDAMLPHPTKDCFMYGKNPMGIPLMSKRLIKVFKKHGIE